MLTSGAKSCSYFMLCVISLHLRPIGWTTFTSSYKQPIMSKQDKASWLTAHLHAYKNCTTKILGWVNNMCLDENSNSMTSLT